MARCRELSQQIHIARTAGDRKLERSLTIEWEITSDLADDLQNPEHAAELYGAKGSIESITADGELESPAPFPELTDEYRDYLARHLPAVNQPARGVAC
jgi:hypothetical protein